MIENDNCKSFIKIILKKYLNKYELIFDKYLTKQNMNRMTIIPEISI